MQRTLMSALLVAAVAGACGGGTEGSAPAPEARQGSTELTGCYDVTSGGLTTVPAQGGSGFEIPPRIQFSGRGFHNASATRIVVPEGALPSIHGFTSAWVSGDSLRMSFSTGYIGVGATLGPSGDGWVGTARAWSHYRPPQVKFEPWPVELAPVPCDSPPPVSIDVMRPLGRSVTFADGRIITVGEQVPEWLETIIDEDGNGELTGVGPMQGIFGIPERITVSVRRNYGGLVTRVRLWYPETAFGTLEERLRDEYGAPEGTDVGVVRYENRITALVLFLWDADNVVILDLRDRRWL